MNSLPFKFTSGPNKKLSIVLLVFTAFYLTLLGPIVLFGCNYFGIDDANYINFIFYAIATVATVAMCFSVLKEDYNSFVTHPFFCILTVLGCFLIAKMLDSFVNILVFFLMDGNMENLNNNEVMAEYGTKSTGAIRATALFLAPIAEELMFRVGVFGTARRFFKKSWPAYIIGVVIFSLYHVAAYAFEDPSYLYMGLLYIPVSFALCFCYERTNSVWASILLHFVNNAIALGVLSSGLI